MPDAQKRLARPEIERNQEETQSMLKLEAIFWAEKITEGREISHLSIQQDQKKPVLRPAQVKRTWNLSEEQRTMLTAKVQDVMAKVDLAGQNLLVATNRSDLQNLRRRSRAFRTALAWGMGHMDHISQRCGWPDVVKDKIARRIQEIAKTPLESSLRRMTQMVPMSWGADCSTNVQWAYEIIDMIHSAVTTEDWSLVDCQEYLVDSEMSVMKAVAALEVASQAS
jgi:hypothetical protein